MNDVWITFRKGIPTDVFMSRETAEKHRFQSESVGHYINVENGGDKTREEQLVRANLALAQQVEDLTRMLEKAERRMGVIEQLGGVPALLRRGRAA